MALLTGDGLQPLTIALIKPIDVFLGVFCQGWGVTSNNGLTLVPLNLQLTQFLDRRWDCFCLKRDSPDLWSLLPGVRNLESRVENVSPLPQISDFALATIKDRGKLLAVFISVLCRLFK